MEKKFKVGDIVISTQTGLKAKVTELCPYETGYIKVRWFKEITRGLQHNSELTEESSYYLSQHQFILIERNEK